MIFLHTSRQVYAEHGIFTRILVIHFIQWRHLANIEQLDNAVSKLKPNGLLTVILTYAALSDVTQTLFTVFVSCKQDC